MTKKKQNGIRKRFITCVIFAFSFCIVASSIKRPQQRVENEDTVLEMIVRMINSQMEESFFMLSAYLEKSENKSWPVSEVLQAMTDQILLYQYAQQDKDEPEMEDDYLAERIRITEGTDEDRKEIEESSLDYEEDAIHIENSIIEEMQRENSRYVKQDGPENEEEILAQQEEGEIDGFQKQQYPAYTYDWSENWDYEELISNFYAIDNTTSLKEEYMDLDQLLYQDLSVDKSAEGPQILIYHTHSQEGFVDSVPGDPSTTIVGAGERLAELLEEEYGFRVLHHTGEYDVENRDYAYSNSLPEIEKLLEENPSIEVVIDLHRDEMKEGKKLVMDLQGKPTARFMFFNGMSYIRDKGDITYLENPYIEDNLAFSFQAQVAANEYYPGIARRIYLKAYRYNMHLRPKSMLIELGAQTNTVEEIMNACDPLAHIIAIVLSDEM